MNTKSDKYKHLTTFAEAIEEGKGTDALCSIIPGKLVIYFFHDGWNFVCKK